MADDGNIGERTSTASAAVFLFAIARHWRQVRASDGTLIPNHLFASSRAGCFLLEGGPPDHLRREWGIPPGGIHLGPANDTIDDVIAYLGLNDDDIAFLQRYYRLAGGLQVLSFFRDRGAFLRLCERTPRFTVDMRDIAKFAGPAAPDAHYADPETLDELLYLDPDTLVPLNTTYEFVLGKGDREAGRRALNDIELAEGILVREGDVHIAIRDFVEFIEKDTCDPLPHNSGR